MNEKLIIRESPYYKDAYLVLRALCRLSMKPISEL